MRMSNKQFAGLCAGLVCALWAGAAAAEDEAGPRQAHEGTPEARAAYFAQRHVNPYDPAFNVAGARLNAYNDMVSAQARLATNLPSSLIHLETWKSVGPAPILDGQTPGDFTTPSPVSGRVSAIAIDPIDNAVYVGGAQGGVWRTLNNGASWTALTNNLGSLAIGAIAIAPGNHPVNQATIFIGTGEGNYSADSYGGVGIYKSTDSGRTWSGPFGATLFTGRSVNGIAVDRTNPNRVLAVSGSGTYGVGGVLNPTLPTRGIFLSTDGGLTWTQQTTQAGNDPGSQIMQDPVVATTWWSAGYSVSATTGGLQKSIDNGVTWVQVAGTGGLPALSTAWGRAWITGTAAPGDSSSTLYLGNSLTTGNPGSQGGKVYKSTDGGATWAEVTAARGYCQGQCFYDLPLAVEPGNPAVLYTGGAGNAGGSIGAETVPSLFMRSDNGGTSFVSHVRSSDGLTALHADMHAIAVWPGQPNRVWVGNDGGVWRSDDKGGKWVNVNTNLTLTQFTGCDLHPTSPSGAYGGTQDNGTEGYTGTVGWPHLDFGDGGYALIDQGNPNNLVHTYFNQSSYLLGVGFTTAGFSTTQGGYFGSFADPDPGVGNGIGFSDRVLFYAPIHLDRGHSDTLYYGTNKLYRAPAFFAQTVDGGGNGQPGIFSALGSGSGGQDLTGGNGAISAIETVANVVPNTDAQVIFTGSNNGHVFRSIDGGASFTEVDALPALIPLFVSDIAVNPRNTNVVFQARAGFSTAAPYQNVRRSLDGGLTWTNASNGLPNVPVNAIAFDPVFPGQIWAGTDVGMYLSQDNGDTWIPYNDGMPNVQVVDLKANRNTHTILACTHGRGAFTLDLDAIYIDGFDGN